MNSRDEGGNVLLSGAAVLPDIIDGAIQGVDGLPRLLLPLDGDDGVASDLVLERT